MVGRARAIPPPVEDNVGVVERDSGSLSGDGDVVRFVSGPDSGVGVGVGPSLRPLDSSTEYIDEDDPVERADGGFSDGSSLVLMAAYWTPRRSSLILARTRSSFSFTPSLSLFLPKTPSKRSFFWSGDDDPLVSRSSCSMMSLTSYDSPSWTYEYRMWSSASYRELRIMAFPGSRTSTPLTEFVCVERIARCFSRKAALCAAIISCLDNWRGLCTVSSVVA